ncbi:hypothetical protein OC834_007684, partial [Tilletia horrida]
MTTSTPRSQQRRAARDNFSPEPSSDLGLLLPSSPPFAFAAAAGHHDSSPFSGSQSSIDQDFDDLIYFNDDVDEDGSDLDDSAGPSAPWAKRGRLHTTMSERDVIDLLRFFKARHLSINSLLTLLFSTDRPQRRESYPDGPDPPSSQPSTYQTDPHSLHVRVRRWLSGDGPVGVARRWTGMDRFALDHVMALVGKEAKRASSSSYLAGPSAGKLKHEDLSSYSMQQAAKELTSSCPMLTHILHAIVAEEPPKEGVLPELSARKRQKRRHTPDVADAMSSTDSESGDSDDSGKRKRKRPALLWKRGGIRSKANIVFTIMLMLLFALSRRCSRFQQVLGLVLFAARAKKRPQELLARAGMSVSVKTVKAQAESLAKDAMERARKQLSDPGVLFSLSIDNLNWLLKAAGATATFRSAMLAAVAGKIYILDGKVQYQPNDPTCSTELFRLLFGPDLALPTHQPRPVNELKEDGTPKAHDRKLYEEQRAAFLSGHKEPYAFIIGKADQQHLSAVAVSHCLSDWLSRRPECAHMVEKVSAPPQVFPLVPAKTKVVPLPIYDENEGSIAGNIKVLKHICSDVGLKEERLESTIVPTVGDAFTATMQRSAIDRRSDDLSDTPHSDRLLYLHPWAAQFHLQMAYQKYLIETHAGSSAFMDLVSLRRMGSKTGFKTTGKIEFNHADAFLRTVFTALTDTIITTALREAGLGEDEALRSDEDPDRTLVDGANGEAGDGSSEVEAMDGDADDGVIHRSEADNGSGDDGDVPAPTAGPEAARPMTRGAVRVERLALPEGGLRKARHVAGEFSKLDWDKFFPVASAAIQKIMSGDIASLSRGQASSPPDLLFAHAVTIFRDLVVYIEHRHAVKHGDIGRVFAMVRQALPRFEAANSRRY